MSGSPFGFLEYKSSSKAADAQVEAADKAAAVQLQMYNQSREDLAPWREAGKTALNTLGQKLQKGPGEFVPEKDPGYKFGYQEFVENPTLKLASATGKLGSGATLKALTRYASDYASTKYDNFLSRYYDTLKPYQSLAGLGQTSATGSAEAAMRTGTNLGTAYQNAGAAQAAGYLGQANALGNSMGQAGKQIGNWATQNSMLNQAGYSWGNTVAGSAAGADSMIWL